MQRNENETQKPHSGNENIIIRYLARDTEATVRQKKHNWQYHLNCS